MTKARTICLIRHASPYEPGEAVRCLGKSDPPLSGIGMRQAGKLADWFRDKPLTAVYTSPLLRCRETAEAVTRAALLPVPVIKEDLRELDAGIWDGLTFAEIREKYPQEYEQRGMDLTHIPPPGGESFALAGERFSLCMNEILAESRGDIAVVAHAGVIRAFCCMLLSKDMNTLLTLPQPCGGITILNLTSDEIPHWRDLRVEKTGFKPESFFDEEELQRLYEQFGTPGPVKAHMRAVAAYLDGLLSSLPESYDRRRLLWAALAHDCARTRKHHADAAAAALGKAGYPQVAALVKVHQSPSPTDASELTEADLLFYADKRFSGTELVSVEERFARSLEKCRTPEALENHRRMYEKTILIEKKIEQYSYDRNGLS